MVGAIRWLNVNASHFMRCQRVDIDCVRAGKVKRDHGRYHRRDLPNSRASVAFTRATMTARSSEPAWMGPVASSIASGDPASRRSRLRAKISLMRAARSFTIVLRPNCASGPSKSARTVISTRVAAPHGLIADHARLAVERRGDRAEFDRELPLQPAAARAAERGYGHARDHAFDLG